MTDQLSGFRKIGTNVKIFPMARVMRREGIEIGSNVIIDDFVFIVGNKPDVSPVKIGNFCHIASFTSITGGGELILEDFTGCSSGVRIITGSEYFQNGECLTNPTVPSPFRKAYRSKVHVCKHSILGINAAVLPGVTIGEGCAVGACSLVTKDLEPWGVYAGIPARRIKERPRETILRLEKELLSTCNAQEGMGVRS